MSKNSIVALDVGTTKTCAVIASYQGPKLAWKIQGIGLAGTDGMKKGKLSQPGIIINSIKLALQRAQTAAKISPKNVILSLPVSTCHNFWNQQTISFYTKRKIKKDDLRYLQKKLSEIKLNKKINIIKTSLLNFSLDNQKEITSLPLDKEAQNVTASGVVFYLDEIESLRWQQLLRSIGFEKIFFGISLESQAQIIIPQIQSQAGVILLDLGGGLIQIGLFLNNKLQRATYLSIAGNHVLTDIMYGVNTTAGEARRLLFQYGKVKGQADENEMIPVLGENGEEKSQVSLNYFYKIINARIEEIFDLIKDKLKQWERESITLPETICLGGGLSLLPGISALAEKSLNKKIFAFDKKKNIPFASAEGLLQAVKKDSLSPQSLSKKIFGSFNNWCKEFI